MIGCLSLTLIVKDILCNINNYYCPTVSNLQYCHFFCSYKSRVRGHLVLKVCSSRAQPTEEVEETESNVSDEDPDSSGEVNMFSIPHIAV